MTRAFKSERAAEQQRRIEDSLLALMAQRDYGQIPVSEICSHSGLPRRTFYYYFENKEAVLNAVIQRLLDSCELEAMFTLASRRETLEESLTRFFEYWQSDGRDALKILSKSGKEQLLMNCSLKWVNTAENWRHLMERYTEEMQAIGSLLGVSCVFYTLFYWCDHGFTQSPQRLAAYVAQILTQPIYDIS